MVKHMSRHVSKHAPGESVYERYLRTEELLSLQKPEDELVHHDELQFQVVHQVFELWWKEAAFELRSIRSQHFKLARRMIGPGSTGTGGTPMELLERTLKDVFYPELWEVRNELTRIADEQGLK